MATPSLLVRRLGCRGFPIDQRNHDREGQRELDRQPSARSCFAERRSSLRLSRLARRVGRKRLSRLRKNDLRRLRWPRWLRHRNSFALETETETPEKVSSTRVNAMERLGSSSPSKDDSALLCRLKRSARPRPVGDLSCKPHVTDDHWHTSAWRIGWQRWRLATYPRQHVKPTQRWG